MTRALAYGRVSTTGQADRGNSIAAQSDQFVRFAALKEFDLGAAVERDFGEHGRLTTRENILFEATSAFKNRFVERPVGAEIVRRLNAGDALLFSKLDRGWRDTADCLNTLSDLQRRGVKVYILNVMDSEPINLDSWAGKLLITILAAFADCESGIKSERLKDANRVRKQNGLPTPGQHRVMFKKVYRHNGHRDAPAFIPCPEQRKHATLFFQLFARNKWDVVRITTYAKAKSIRIPLGAVQPRKQDIHAAKGIYSRQRVGAMIRAEYQIRVLARLMDKPIDDEGLVYEWRTRTQDETREERFRSVTQTECAKYL